MKEEECASDKYLIKKATAALLSTCMEQEQDASIISRQLIAMA